MFLHLYAEISQRLGCSTEVQDINDLGASRFYSEFMFYLLEDRQRSFSVGNVDLFLFSLWPVSHRLNFYSSYSS